LYIWAVSNALYPTDKAWWIGSGVVIPPVPNTYLGAYMDKLGRNKVVKERGRSALTLIPPFRVIVALISSVMIDVLSTVPLGRLIGCLRGKLVLSRADYI